MLDKLLVQPSTRPGLGKRKTDEDFGWEKDTTKAETDTTIGKVAELHNALIAEERRSVLVVVQAMDAAGKDGVIRTLLTGLNPAGIAVTGFGVPTATELSHDYLWRVHAALPPRGRIGVFNRSHYEDVLVVRVRGFQPQAVWKKRYRHIREFEQMVVDEGTTVVKFFLHIGLDEQRARLQDRINDPAEQWKFRKGDLDDRALWSEYMKAYEDAIAETSTAAAPWYVIPADRKWVRNRCVAEVLHQTMKKMKPKYPPAEEGIEGLVVE